MSPHGGDKGSPERGSGECATTSSEVTASYICTLCTNSYTDLLQLRRHLQSHSEVSFKCSYCGRNFKHKRSRDRHLKLHTGDRKYKCTYCFAAFSRSDHLKIHLKTHSNHKPHRCILCHKGYTSLNSLSNHMETHRTDKNMIHHAENSDFGQSMKSSHSPAIVKDASDDSSTSPSKNMKANECSDKNASRSFATLLRDSPSANDNGHPPHGIDIKVEVKENDDNNKEQSEESSIAGSIAKLFHKCVVCGTQCKSSSHLQRHINRNHTDIAVTLNRPASTGTASGSSGGPRSTSSSPSLHSPRPLISPRLPLLPSPLSQFLSPGLNSLNPHALLALMGGKLACTICHRDTFTSLEELQVHIQTVHGHLLSGDFSSEGAAVSGAPLPHTITCELCGARVSDVSALQHHVVTCHSFTDLLARTAEGVFCAQCLLPFSNPGALTEHIKLVHTNVPNSLGMSGKHCKRPLSPPDLPTDLSKKACLESNQNELSSRTLLCSQCNASFNNFESFRTHLKNHLDSQQQSNSAVICPECKMSFASEAELESHLSSHFFSLSTEYGCQACFKLFSKPDELQKHLLDIHAHHIYRCSLCKEMFDSKVSIQVHFAVKHSNECKVKKCSKCGISFKSLGDFDLHIKNVHMRSDIKPPVEGFRCLLCHTTLADETELSLHLATHQKQFQCQQCSEAFHVEFLLDRHIQQVHSTSVGLINSSRSSDVPNDSNTSHADEMKCELCYLECPTESALLSHYQKRHQNKSSGGLKIAASTVSLFCAYCNESCKSRSELEVHVKVHQGAGGRHKCNICDELFPSASTLAQHKLAHIKTVSSSCCSICHVQLLSSDQVTEHQNDHHPGSLPQPCVVCRQTLITNAELKVHAKFHGTQKNNPPVQQSYVVNIDKGSLNNNNNNIDAPVKCTNCHVKFESLDEIDKHSCSQNTSTNCSGSYSRTYQCIKCQESFALESEVEAHVALHVQTEGSSLRCHLCHADYDSPLRLQCHLIEHTFEGCGSYTCYLCSAVYTGAHSLQKHMLDHGFNAKPYDCHHCHLRFFFKAELENHILSHSRILRDSCNECKFSPRDNMNSEKKEFPVSKSPDKPKPESFAIKVEKSDGKISCTTCGRKCSDENSRKIHELTHEGGRPYLCKLCGVSFTRKCDAVKHAKAHSNDQNTLTGTVKCGSCDYEADSSIENHVVDVHGSQDNNVTVRPNSVCSSCEEEEMS